MKKFNTSPISGMQEFLPSTQAIFDQIKAKIGRVYHVHGFQHIETPTIDRNEILFAKAGGDTEKQIYRVIKTDESAEASTEALRFDHTVPLARYIVEHESSLNFPFRVTQIGKNFRGERSQKGRFREFYQCDVDVIGRNDLSITYDAQVIYTFYEALRSFVKVPIKIRINNRKFLNGILETLELTDKSADIYSIIDHSEKVSSEKTTESLKEIGLSEDNVVKITTFINTHGDFNTIKVLGFDNEGLKELETVYSELQKLGIADAIEIDLKIVRGLDYYTGTVFEAILPDYPTIGSIGGGGRYENLASNYIDQKFPGVGASIGLSRLFYIMQENELINEAALKPIDIAIIPLGEDSRAKAYELAAKLRGVNKTVDIILADKKLGDLMKHAAKIAKGGIVVGEDEAKSGNFMLKDFATGDSKPLEI